MPRDILPYLDLLGRIHRHVRPRTYLEIGVAGGRSLARALPETHALAIDPRRMRFVEPVHCSVTRFEMTSDDFFERDDPKDLLATLDLAFIDGMHLFEFPLGDFINIESSAREDSVVLIHDCNPVDEITAARTQTTKFWTGDVWKVIPILREYRPDLDVVVVDSGPSGLGLVTGLDPGSTVLADSFDEIRERFTPLGYDTVAGNRAILNLIDDEWEAVRSLLPGPFNAPVARDS